jgi:hypothetical protein
VAVQEAEVVNAGVGVANSGLNAAVGNSSDNDADVDQDADGALAFNSANTSNKSDGSASIRTGAATATGNDSRTSIAQSADGGDGPGVSIVVQDSDVLNAGLGIANSGLNFARGNNSENEAEVEQEAEGLLAANTATTTNSSNGSASITTGAATGTGNRSSTGITQEVASDPGGLNIVVQEVEPVNFGIGIANTGLNFNDPNNSVNVLSVNQFVAGLLAFNQSLATNSANGSATTVTGAGVAVGNDSKTKTTQTA